MPEGWEWDETLFLGTAAYYVQGRLPYAPGLPNALREALALDGQGRLLDVGCGPGVLALALAPRFAEVVGIDPDAGMLEEAARRAADARIGNARWVQLRAEDLPAGLGAFRAATFGQSFHWMDRDRVAATILAMLEPGGVFVHISDLKTPPAPIADPPYPPPPHEAILSLVRHVLGPVRRAGQGVLLHGSPSGEAAVLSRAGFGERERLVVPSGEVLTRTTDDVVAAVFSLSGSAPHLFGARLAEFETALRTLLHAASPADRFAERAPDTEVMIWRKAQRGYNR